MKKMYQELDKASQRVSGYSPEQKKELEDHARKVAKESKPKWKKVSKSDGETVVVCNCLDNWKDAKNVCPVHG